MPCKFPNFLVNYYFWYTKQHSLEKILIWWCCLGHMVDVVTYDTLLRICYHRCHNVDIGQYWNLIIKREVAIFLSVRNELQDRSKKLSLWLYLSSYVFDNVLRSMYSGLHCHHLWFPTATMCIMALYAISTTNPTLCINKTGDSMNTFAIHCHALHDIHRTQLTMMYWFCLIPGNTFI